jgi:hypothetical protein
MNWKLIGKIWLVGLGIFMAGSLLIGCGNKNWSPTDPRVDTPDASQTQIVDSWQLQIDTSVTP